MVSVPNPKGGSMEVSSTADAVSKGWTPSMGTFGTSPDGDSGGAPAKTESTPGAPPVAGAPDLSGYVAAMQASSGLSIKQLDEQKREFDLTLQQKKDEWTQQGLPQLVIQQRTADLEDAKFAELQKAAVFSQNLQTAQQALDDKIKSGQLSVSQAQQDLADRIQTGQLAVSQDQQALARQIQTGQLAVSQGQLGLDTLKTAASLSGPSNWIQAANFARGVGANATLPGFVSNLLNGQATGMGAPTAAGALPSDPATLQTLAGAMGVNAPATLPAGAPQATGTDANTAAYQAALAAKAAAPPPAPVPVAPPVAAPAPVAKDPATYWAGASPGNQQAYLAAAGGDVATAQQRYAVDAAKAEAQAVAAYQAAHPAPATVASLPGAPAPVAPGMTTGQGYDESAPGTAQRTAQPGMTTGQGFNESAAGTPQRPQPVAMTTNQGFSESARGTPQRPAWSTNQGYNESAPGTPQRPQQQGGGFMTETAGGPVYTPSAAETAAAGGTSSQAAGLDANHMADFYAKAVAAANTGGPTGQPAPGAAGTGIATMADLNTAFGRPAAAAAAPAGGDQNAQSQAALSKLFAQGGQSLAPQALEGLSPTETAIMQGGGAALGYDVPGYVSAYQNSRIGQKAKAPTSV